MILDLPWEIRQKVVSYCSISDVKSLALACSACNDALKKRLFQAVRVPILNLLKNNLDNDKQLENFRQTKILRFCNFGCSYYLFTSMRKKISIVELSVKYKRILKYCNPNVIAVSFYLPKSAFRIISRFDNLTELHVTGGHTNLDDHTLLAMCENFITLKVLDIRGSKISDIGLLNINKLISLQELNVKCCIISDVGLSYVGSLIHLKELDISNCFNITDAGMSHITSLVMLTNLNVSGCSIKNIGLSCIGKLPKLEVLDMRNCFYVTDIDMLSLSTLITLNTLYISTCPRLTDKVILNFGCLVNLKRLEIANTDITDIALSYMCNFPSLEFLSIIATKVTNNGLQYLTSMKVLKKLRWEYTEITAEGLQENHLSKLI